MIGKKNIVFGFFYLVLTSALGPYMILNYFDTYNDARAEKQQLMSELALIKDDDFEKDLEAVSDQDLSRLNTGAILISSKVDNAHSPIELIRGGAHAHGNLEAVLNIVVGVVLCFVAVAPLFKQIISWCFIIGTIMHAGMQYLMLFNFEWAGQLLGSGIGPVLILSGLMLAGIATAIGFRGELVEDYD